MASKFRKPLSASTSKSLKAKAKKSKLFSLADLKASFRRGQGAFLSGGSRPRMSMNAWAMARVNKLISRGRSGSFDKDIIKRAVKRKKK
tara:strand:+ start:2740 stop:3006 length:267 start_codon:yes stop_codon:yes gene_type:complete